MPTIDQLAPATAASDTDELLASQNGIARKLSRAQLVAGLQPQLALASGMLLGRSATGLGGPEQVSVGANLVLNGGTLSATASPFQVAQLPAGTVPSASDLVPFAHSGTNMVVTYAQFANGLGKISGIDASAMTVTPSGGGTQKLADFAAISLPKTGGVMIGPLTLAADPASPLHAATKQYVDTQTATALPKSGGTVTGAITLSTNPTAPLQAATKQYVDAQIQTVLPLAGGSLVGPLSAQSLVVAGPATIAGKLTSAGAAISQIGTSSGTLTSTIALQRVGSGPADSPVLTSALTVTHPGGGGGTYTNAAFPTVVNDALDANGNLIDGTSNPVRAISSTLVINAVAGSGSQGSGPQHAAFAATATKNAPAGGYPMGRTGPQIFGMLLPVSDATNQPSTISNATVGAQVSLAANNLDPANRRTGHQIALTNAVPLASGGVPAEWSSAISVGTSADSWFKWHFSAAGNYSIAVLDTRTASGARAKVVSSLSVPAPTIAVDPVLPFASAGASGQSVSATNATQIQVGSNAYTLIGVSLDGAGKTSGKLTFSTPVSVADAAAGNVVAGASRAVWLGSGQQLALDTAGAATLFYDANLGAIRLTAPMQVTGALGVTGALNGAVASFSGLVSTTGALQCGGTLTANGGLTTTNAALSGNLSASGTLTVGGAAQFGATTIKGALAATGMVSATGGFAGSAVSVTGSISAGGPLAVSGALAVQGGATITGGAVVLPAYPVSALPPASAGALAYAANGRKPGEAAGAGSGVLVWGTSAKQWLSVLGGTPVQA